MMYMSTRETVGAQVIAGRSSLLAIQSERIAFEEGSREVEKLGWAEKGALELKPAGQKGDEMPGFL